MSTYTGRHRPPTRAERRAIERRSRLPKALTPAYALPTGVAVTLALTAAGATAAQSSPFSGVPADGAQAALTAPSGGQDDSGTNAVSLLEDPEVAESARSEVAAESRNSSGLTERRRAATETVARDQGREQERERAARSEARQERAEKKREQKRAEKAEEERSSAGSSWSADSSSEANAEGWVRPLDSGSLSSGFGQRWGRMHSGLDYSVPVGTPLKAMNDGTVVGAGPMSGYGNYIDIEFEDGTVSRYGHLDSVSASTGQQVSAGDVVALSGNTGQSTGPHLHLEIHPDGGQPIDPAGWLDERGID